MVDRLVGRIEALEVLDVAGAAALGVAACGSLTAPFVALAQTLLYADLCARKGEKPFAPPTEAIA